MVWALSLLTMNLITHRLTPGVAVGGIRSLIGFGTAVSGPRPFSALPPPLIHRGYTSIYFEENQLSPSLISLSPLSTAHPSPFQRAPVRTSIRG